MSATYSLSNVLDAVINADTYILTSAYVGNFTLVDSVIDAELALKKAGISEAHLRLMYCRWVLGLTQKETGELNGYTREAVAKAEERCRTKLQAVLDGWEADAV